MDEKSEDHDSNHKQRVQNLVLETSQLYVDVEATKSDSGSGISDNIQETNDEGESLPEPDQEIAGASSSAVILGQPSASGSVSQRKRRKVRKTPRVATEDDQEPNSDEEFASEDLEKLFNCAVYFALEVQTLFPHLYDEYCDLIMATSTDSMEEEKEFAQKIKKLFKNHPELITIFNAFLSKENQIQDVSCEWLTAESDIEADDQIPSETVAEEKRRLRNEIQFLNEVKETFADKPEVYIEFFDGLQELGVKKTGQEEFISRTLELFKDHPKLADTFSNYKAITN